MSLTIRLRNKPEDKQIKKAAQHCYKQYKLGSGSMLVVGAVMSVRDASEITERDLDKQGEKPLSWFYDQIEERTQIGFSIEDAQTDLMRYIGRTFVEAMQGFIDQLN